MKVCLISPPTVTDFEERVVAESDAVRRVAEHAPIGVLTLAAILEQHGISPRVHDLNRLYYRYLSSEHQVDGGFCEFVSEILCGEPFDVFGFSTICSSYPLTLRIAREVKKRHHASTIVLGGPQASVVDVLTMESFPFVDFILRGEADESFPQLIRSLEGVHPIDEVGGLTLRRQDHVERNPGASLIQDLDSIPIPSFHLCPEIETCGYIPLELGRGCPFACTFCSTNDFFRRRFRLKSPEALIQQMKTVHSDYAINTFDLIHDMFTVNRKKVVAFCEAMIASGEKFYWSCSARTDCTDDELLELMSEAGCRGIFFGIETGSPRLQSFIKKNLDLDDASERVERANALGMNTTISLITGFPGETMDDVTDSVNFIGNALRLDKVSPQFHLLAPLAGTPLQLEHREALRFDELFSDISYQGWRQDPADRELICAYRDIFPNFYAIPNPDLDRPYLQELIGFLEYGREWFRWLLVAAHDDCDGLREVFDQFRQYRRDCESSKGGGIAEGSKRYFSQVAFRKDFLKFMKESYLPRLARSPHVLDLIVAYETALDDALQALRKAKPADTALSTGPMGVESVPKLADSVQLISVGAEYETTIRALQYKGGLHNVPVRDVTLAVSIRESDNEFDVLQLSVTSADILRLCDGRRSIGEICTAFADGREDSSGIPPEKICMFGLRSHYELGMLSGGAHR